MSIDDDHKNLVPLDKSWQPVLPGELAKAGEAANQAAARYRFVEYQQRRSLQTLRRQKADLALFSKFLNSLGINLDGNLETDIDAWRGITWGLVEAYNKWQLQEGYALPSINVHLSTIKTYSKLAMQAGVIAPETFALIHSVSSYTHKEQRRIDQRRSKTRIGLKKSSPVMLTKEQAGLLKSQPSTPQGRRDNLLMCLLLDHGLRVGEISILSIDMFDIHKGILHFFRPKVSKFQTHLLSEDTLRAVLAYMRFGDMPSAGPLLRKSKKDDSLTDSGMTERGITQRVKILGDCIGVSGLSAHDCRHYWATTAARHGTDPFILQEAGGWSSLAMPRRYVEENVIANEGVILK
jgi:integrase